MMPTAYDLPLTGLNYLEYYSGHNVYHTGIDFNKGKANEDCGQVVKAPRDGFVVYVWDTEKNSGGFGKFVIMLHADGSYTRCAHLNDITVKAAQEVKEGEIIGHMGKTGTTYCHLHFEVFNKLCAEKQSKNWKPWRWYPSGLSKAEVQKYYLNPWEWLKKSEVNPVPVWAADAVQWATNNQIINNFEGNSMSDYEIATVLKRFYDKFMKIS